MGALAIAVTNHGMDAVSRVGVVIMLMIQPCFSVSLSLKAIYAGFQFLNCSCCVDDRRF
jgi:hypothetical protein